MPSIQFILNISYKSLLRVSLSFFLTMLWRYSCLVCFLLWDCQDTSDSFHAYILQVHLFTPSYRQSFSSPKMFLFSHGFICCLLLFAFTAYFAINFPILPLYHHLLYKLELPYLSYSDTNISSSKRHTL